jgi:hypothetical protein
VSWIDRAVFCVVDEDTGDTVLDALVGHGINALCVEEPSAARGSALGREPSAARGSALGREPSAARESADRDSTEPPSVAQSPAAESTRSGRAQARSTAGSLPRRPSPLATDASAARGSAEQERLLTLVRAAHGRDMRVCIEVSGAFTSSERDKWSALGVDGFLATDAGITAVDAVHLRTNLFHLPDGRCYFDGRGGGDFSSFWRAFEGARRMNSDRRIAISTSDDRAQVLAAGREPDDLEVIYAFLLTWPCVPLVRLGDELGAPSQFERLSYVRTTEDDLEPSAPLQVLSSDSAGYPLVYRRGATILVALNPGAVAQRVTLADVGDARPIAARHCHLTHEEGRWCARLAPAGYGVFNIT